MQVPGTTYWEPLVWCGCDNEGASPGPGLLQFSVLGTTKTGHFGQHRLQGGRVAWVCCSQGEIREGF